MPELSIPGKRTLFLSGGKLDKDHRLMEKITTIVEAHLRDDRSDEVLAYSSVKVRDLAGSLRELDVAFTRASRPEEVFASVEVKHHGRKVGPEYVEGVAGKRQSVQVADATLVSTSGFTENTPSLAGKLGLLTRTLREVRAEEATWFTHQGITVEMNMLSLHKVALITVDQAGIAAAVELTAADWAVESLMPIDWSSGQLSVAGQTALSPTAIYKQQVELRLGEIPIDAPATIRVQSEPGDRPRPAYIVTLEGGEQRLVPVVVFNAIWEKRSHVARFTRRFEYVDALTEQLLAELLLADTEIPFQTSFSKVAMVMSDTSSSRQISGAYFA